MQLAIFNEYYLIVLLFICSFTWLFFSVLTMEKKPGCAIRSRKLFLNKWPSILSSSSWLWFYCWFFRNFEYENQHWTSASWQTTNHPLSKTSFTDKATKLFFSPYGSANKPLCLTYVFGKLFGIPFTVSV